MHRRMAISASGTEEETCCWKKRGKNRVIHHGRPQPSRAGGGWKMLRLCCRPQDAGLSLRWNDPLPAVYGCPGPPRVFLWPQIHDHLQLQRVPVSFHRLWPAEVKWSDGQVKRMHFLNQLSPNGWSRTLLQRSRDDHYNWPPKCWSWSTWLSVWLHLTGTNHRMDVSKAWPQADCMWYMKLQLLSTDISHRVSQFSDTLTSAAIGSTSSHLDTSRPKIPQFVFLWRRPPPKIIDWLHVGRR